MMREKAIEKLVYLDYSKMITPKNLRVILYTYGSSSSRKSEFYYKP